MKLLKRLSTSLLVAASLAPAVQAQQSRYDEFVKKFAQALSINDRAEMGKLVKSYQVEAVMRTEYLCSSIATYATEEMEREIDGLNKSWQASMKGKFVENYYAYLALMKPPAVKERERLKGAYDIQFTKFLENQTGARDGPVFERVAGEMKAIAGAFKQIGDRYYEAQAWMVYGLAYTPENRERKEADKARVYEGYKSAIEAFDAIDLNYTRYKELLPIYETLKAEGWGEMLDNPDGPPPGAPRAAAGAATTTIALSFEPIEKLDAFERPNYFVDEMYQMWPAIPLSGKGSSGKFNAIEKGPLVKRSTSSKLELDFDRDGTAEAEIKLTGKQAVVEIDLVDGGAPRKWAFLMATGQEQDKYQGLQINLQPDDIQMSLFYINAGSMVGTLGDQPIRIIDDNADGLYGSPPKAFGYPGLAADQFHPEMDSLVVGTAKRAIPWSEYVKLGEQWYQLESANSGTVLNARPMEIETGTLKLKYKGPPVEWMVVRGEAKLENCFFDVMANGKAGVEVPKGHYELYVGLVAKGKKQQRMKALVLPGHNTPTWEVKAGEETEIELGAPFGFEFITNKSGEQVTVVGKSVTIVGSGGERYERTWNCAPRPEGSVRKEGAKKGGKAEKFDVVMDMNEIKEDGTLRYSYYDPWRPLDAVLEWKKDDPYQVQLVEKKNKLFGKIESEWL
jgi:hypothetical protein